MGKNLAFGPFRLNADDGTLFNGSSAITIGSRAAALLRALIEARGAVVPKSALMDAVWPGVAVEESNLTVQIAALRRVLGKDWIATAVRNGYRLGLPQDWGCDGQLGIFRVCSLTKGVDAWLGC